MAEVEFIDADGEFGDGESSVGPDEEQGVVGGDGSLPPHAARTRVRASLLALAALAAGVAGCFTAAYHRHETDVRIANVLDLRDVRAAPSVPGLAALGNASRWRAQVSERVLIPVANASPEPVTLLGAVLNEPGLVRPAAFSPVGSGVLAPGRTGQVAGNVVVDCTADLSGNTAQVVINGTSSTSFVDGAAQDGLLVRARTSGGTVGTAHLEPDAPDAGGAALQQRICLQQGNVTWPTSMTATGDPKTHVISVALSAQSIADVPLTYTASASYSAAPEAGGVIIASTPLPLSPSTGTVQPGGRLRVAFSIPLTSCPSTPPPSTDTVYIDVILEDGPAVAGAASGFVGFDVPLASACAQPRG